jgi:hypothetical protein
VGFTGGRADGATVTRDRAGFGDDFVESDSLNLRLSSAISSHFLNEFRFLWADELDTQFAQPPLPASRPLLTAFLRR